MFRFNRIQKWAQTSAFAQTLTRLASTKGAQNVRFTLKGMSALLLIEVLDEANKVIAHVTIQQLQVSEKSGEANFSKTVSAQRATEMAGHAGRQAGAQKKVNEKIEAANQKLAADKQQPYAGFLMTINPHSNELQMKVVLGDNVVGKNLVTFGIGQNAKKATFVKKAGGKSGDKKKTLPSGKDFPKGHGKKPKKGQQTLDAS